MEKKKKEKDKERGKPERKELEREREGTKEQSSAKTIGRYNSWNAIFVEANEILSIQKVTHYYRRGRREERQGGRERTRRNYVRREPQRRRWAPFE